MEVNLSKNLLSSTILIHSFGTVECRRNTGDTVHDSLVVVILGIKAQPPLCP